MTQIRKPRLIKEYTGYYHYKADKNFLNKKTFLRFLLWQNLRRKFDDTFSYIELAPIFRSRINHDWKWNTNSSFGIASICVWLQ